MSAIDEIKARIDIVDLVSETVQLRRSGKNYTGFCPFHANQRTPAFAVFPDSGTWRCFGQCNEGGDIFKFVMKKEGWDFSETLRFLAERSGVTLHTPTIEEQAQAEEYAALRALLEEAVVFYHHQLVHTPAGKPALEYLRQKRGLKDETIEAFGLGYAPLGWDHLLNHFKGKGYSDDELVDAGLVSVREAAEEGHPAAAGRSGRFDRFRHRILFPIRDERGRMAGFGARIMNPEDVPKFLNSPQGPVFDKGHLLYGLDKARKAIRESGQAVIVEGYLDVIALHQAGFANAVSPMGTALTGHQLGLLKRAAQRIILALDPDAAGNQATLRGLQVARQTLDRTTEHVFDARGLLSQEARLEADIRVTTLPEGEDPDEVVGRDPQLWLKIVQDAKPVVVHVMEALAAGRNLDDPKVKTELANQVLPLIEDVPSPIERDTFRQRLARLLRVSERALLEMPVGEAGAGRGRRRASTYPLPRPAGTQAAGAQAAAAAQAVAGEGKKEFGSEAHCLGMLLRRPDLLCQVDRHLQEGKLPRLTAEEFHDASHQTIFRLLQESIEQDMAEPINFVMANLSLDMMEVADDLLVQTAKSVQPATPGMAAPLEDRVLEDLMRGILDMRRRSLYQELDYVRFLQEEARGEGDLHARQYHQMLSLYTRTKMLLDKALNRYTSRVNATRQGGD